MSNHLPSGTVTFLFSDIEGSTRLLHELGDAYADALAAHRRVLREAFGRHGGVEVDAHINATTNPTDHRLREQALEALRLRIGDEVAHACLAEGHQMGIEQAMNCAARSLGRPADAASC